MRELNELKSRFYTMAAHEVRMPLAIILTSTQLLRNYQDRMSVERQLEYFNRIEAQVWCLTEMTEDALTVNQADSMGMAFNPERLNIESFCRTVVDETRPTVSTHKIQFTVNGKCEL